MSLTFGPMPHTWSIEERTYDLIEVRPSLIGQGVSITVPHHSFTHPDVRFGSYNHVTGGTTLHLAFPMAITLQARNFVDDEPSFIDVKFWRLDTEVIRVRLAPGDSLLDDTGRIIAKC